MKRKLRVWHIPNVPGPVFYQRVRSLSEALVVLRSLARYDLYLGELIHTNAQGLQAFVEGEWLEWHDSSGDDVTNFLIRTADEPVKPRNWRGGQVVEPEESPEVREAKRKKEATRKRISEGTRAGLAKSTKPNGRPALQIPLVKLERVRQGKLSVQALAEEVGCKPITVKRRLSRLSAQRSR